MPFSKYNIGIAISLILVVLLSQSKNLNFFLNTILGKSILIMLLIFIASIHKILGVIVILFIIIFFNNSDLVYLEGFTDNTKLSSSSSSNKDVSMTDDTSIKDKVKENVNVISNSTNNKIESNDNKKQTAIAKEGFDIIGTENNIKRGKQSNSIPVNDKMRISSDVLPHEGNSFSNFSSMVYLYMINVWLYTLLIL